MSLGNLRTVLNEKPAVAMGAVCVVIVGSGVWMYTWAGNNAPSTADIDAGWICSACNATLTREKAVRPGDDMNCTKCGKNAMEWRGLHFCMKCEKKFDGYRQKWAPYPEGFKEAAPDQHYHIKYPGKEWEPAQALARWQREVKCPDCNGMGTDIIPLGSRQWQYYLENKARQGE